MSKFKSSSVRRVVVEELTFQVALKTAIGQSLNNNGMQLTKGVVKGLGQVVRALEAGSLVAVFLAEDCEDANLKDVVIALAKERNVPLYDVPTWVELKDACRLGLDSEKIRELSESKGKEIKLKPRCSVAGIVSWDGESAAVKFLQSQGQ